MSKKIKIIIAEAREVFRKSLSALLHTQTEFQVSADAANGRELLELLKQTPVDIVILDADIPGVDGKTVLEIINRRFSSIRIIILSDRSNAQLQTDFMAYGANSFLSKNCNVKTLFKAIHKVKTEGYFFDDSTSKALLDKVLKDKQRSAFVTEVQFNDREKEILKKICDGNTNKEIALDLHLSPSTIDFYRTKIYGKTKCNNVTGLLKYALKNGLIELT
jgi:DNA-binding NarL/FixJ family response regulator